MWSSGTCVKVSNGALPAQTTPKRVLLATVSSWLHQWIYLSRNDPHLPFKTYVNKIMAFLKCCYYCLYRPIYWFIALRFRNYLFMFMLVMSKPENKGRTAQFLRM